MRRTNWAILPDLLGDDPGAREQAFASILRQLEDLERRISPPNDLRDNSVEGDSEYLRKDKNLKDIGDAEDARKELGAIEDAPINDLAHARKNGKWDSFTIPSSSQTYVKVYTKNANLRANGYAGITVNLSASSGDDVVAHVQIGARLKSSSTSAKSLLANLRVEYTKGDSDYSYYSSYSRIDLNLSAPSLDTGGGYSQNSSASFGTDYNYDGNIELSVSSGDAIELNVYGLNGDNLDITAFCRSTVDFA